jgi:hypothetical protein
LSRIPEPSKTPLRQEEWNFEKLLKDAKLEEVRFCHKYEFGREALDYNWLVAHARLSVGESAVLMQHQILNESFYFFTHYFSEFKTGIWMKVPYFDLPKKFRKIVAEREKRRLASLIDPRQNLDRGPVERVELVIPLDASRAHLCACFAAFLEVKFPKLGRAHGLRKGALPKEGAEAEIRQLKTDLRSLGAFRLCKCLSLKQAREQTKKLSEHPLYSSEPSWSAAKKRAAGVIERIQADLSPVIKLLSNAPKGVTGFFYDSGSGELEYR